MPRHLPSEVIAQRLQVWNSCGKSSKKASALLGIDRRTMDQFLDRYSDTKRHDGISFGHLEQTETIEKPLPEAGTKRYLLTCAQNNTAVHLGLLRNLEAFAKRFHAEILVSGFTYNRNALNTKNEKQDAEQEFDIEVTWAPEIQRYVTGDLQLLAPTLAWCANLQLLPTAVNPMSGLQDYTGQASSVIPHPKIGMEPVPTPRDTPTKHLYSTGCCTMKNYIEQKAGQKAEFHHSFGALLVEVLPDGEWFLRQLVADEEGSFQDAGTMTRVQDGKVRKLHRVAGIQWGDIHCRNVDPKIKKLFWLNGRDSVVDILKPHHQVFHDLVDGESHNHHERYNYHEQYMLHTQGRSDIREEFDEARRFVDDESYRDWSVSTIVWSNHDEFIQRYLKYTDYRRDHVNAVFILELELEAYRAMSRGEKPDLFRRALSSEQCTVLTDDGVSYEIEGVLITFHGNNGAGGSRGSVRQFAKAGAKTATGHSHAAWWVAGATSAGTCSELYLGYNNGLSTWSHTFTVIFEGGKRQQITANRETMRWRG